MGDFFNPAPGLIEVSDWYSDNKVCWRELKFSIPIEKWSEFENSQLCRDLVAYVETLRTPDTPCEHPVQQCTQGTAQSAGSSNLPAGCESFLDQVRKALRRK